MKAFEKLKALQARFPNAMDKGASEKALGQLHKTLPKLPAAWLQVLSATNGGYVPGADFEFTGTGDLPTDQRLAAERFERWGLQNADSLLAIANSGGGDYYALDLSTVNSQGECKVLLIDHEIISIGREWKSVADFIAHLLESADKADEAEISSAKKPKAKRLDAGARERMAKMMQERFKQQQKKK